MLLWAVFFSVTVALTLGAILEGGLAFARVSARHAAQHYAEIGFAQARAALVAGLAAQIQSGATALVAPAPLAATPVCADAATPCPFTVVASFALSGSTAGGANGSNEHATDLQTHPAIGEGRIAASIVETIASRDGTALAVRTQYVTLRTFTLPPFAAIDGTSDAGASREVAAEGDSAGCDPAKPGACDANNVTAGSLPSDTRIHALARCVDGGTGLCNGQVFVSADPTNTPAATPWYNGNAQPESWSR